MSHSSSSEPPSCCSTASSELKLYQTFIFSIPIFFTFLLLFLFYLFYLRRRRVDWSSLRMRASYNINGADSISVPTLSESGLKKEFREMLPIIIFKESFSVKDTQCSVCLADYQADDKLQQIPACEHTFHMECIDHWLTTHTTCPLCRLSLAPVNRIESNSPDNQMEILSSDGLSESGSENGNSRQRETESERGEVERSSCVGSSQLEFCNERREEEEQEEEEKYEEFGETEETSITVNDIEDQSVNIEQGTIRDHP